VRGAHAASAFASNCRLDLSQGFLVSRVEAE
jgi:hypothetical protein